MKKPILILFLGCLLISRPVAAGVYWLPDYLRDNVDINNRTDTPIACKQYSPNCTYPKKLGGELKKIAGNLCYMECVCPKTFVYSQENCKGEYELGALRCDGMAISCNPKSCSEINAYEHPMEGMICEAKAYGGRNCYTCKEDPCWRLTNHYQDSHCQNWGCAQVYAACPEKCELCHEDNCRNRKDNITEAGCVSWWKDCPSKCEKGAICEKKNCADYPLVKAPDNAKYDYCDPGCGQSPRYRIRSCYTGYILSNGSCLNVSSCSPGGYSDKNDPEYCQEVRYNGKTCYDCCYYTETCENSSPYRGVVLKGRNGCFRGGKTYYSDCGWTSCSQSGTPVPVRQSNSWCAGQNFLKYNPHSDIADTRTCVVCL